VGFCVFECFLLPTLVKNNLYAKLAHVREGRGDEKESQLHTHCLTIFLLSKSNEKILDLDPHQIFKLFLLAAQLCKCVVVIFFLM